MIPLLIGIGIAAALVIGWKDDETPSTPKPAPNTDDKPVHNMQPSPAPEPAPIAPVVDSPPPNPE